MPNNNVITEIIIRINKVEKWLRRLESMIIRPTGSGTLHDAVTVEDTATLNLTLTGQSIKGDVIGGSGHTIQDEGVPLANETNLNFEGAGVTATDDPGNNATKVTIPGGVAVANLGSTAETVGGAKDDGVAATASRSDHKHEITNPKLDDLATPDDNTDLNANTTNHGLVVKATAPAATLINVVGIGNGETAYTNKALLDSTAPEALGVAASGSQLVAARRDHVHVMPKLDDTNTPDDNTDLDANTTNHGLLMKATAPAAGLSNVLAIENGETTYKNKALFDTTNPENIGVAAPGTSLLAARRDHVHAGAGGGDVVGPAGATDGHLAVFDGATGKLIKDGGAPGAGSSTAHERGNMVNGKIEVTVASNNLTVSLKNLAGNDPSAGDPVLVRIGDTIRTITAALSVTKNAGTNWCNSGSSELATKEVDYFVYLGYNATDGVVIGFSRIPGGTEYDSFSATTTNEKYCAISNITTAAAGDDYENVGRFAATLSAGAGYTWTVPTFTNKNLIQRPIYETRWLDWQPVFSASGSMTYTSVTTTRAKYKLRYDDVSINIYVYGTTGGTASNTIYASTPFTPALETNGATKLYYTGLANWQIGLLAITTGALISVTRGDSTQNFSLTNDVRLVGNNMFNI